MTTRSNTKINVSVVGATGIVGREFIKILDQRNFPLGDLRLFASKSSRGEKVPFQGRHIEVQTLENGCFEGTQVAFFSAGSNISAEWAPKATREGAFVVDNSSQFRMDADVPLVVPEVNGTRVSALKKPIIIANPNCATIQLVVLLKPLSIAYGLRQVTMATYQSVSGAGKEGVEELKEQTAQWVNAFNTNVTPQNLVSKTFAHPIAFTNLPHIDKFDESGFTFEEKKIMQETQKILDLPELEISVTSVRTPTLNGHSEAVWVDLDKEVSRAELLKTLNSAPGLVIQDDPSKAEYPLNSEASGRDPVYVGRIRRDLKNPKRWLFWVVSDNLRKGAALNGMQIAEILFQ